MTCTEEEIVNNINMNSFEYQTRSNNQGNFYITIIFVILSPSCERSSTANKIAPYHLEPCIVNITFFHLIGNESNWQLKLNSLLSLVHSILDTSRQYAFKSMTNKIRLTPSTSTTGVAFVFILFLISFSSKNPWLISVPDKKQISEAYILSFTL